MMLWRSERGHRKARLRMVSTGLVLAAVALTLSALLDTRGGLPVAPLPANAQGSGYALRFYGNGVDAPSLDRVVIPIDAPARPADVGATDFTIEFWLKAVAPENTGAVQCGANAGWITGNTVIDRDIFGDGDYGDFGIALGGGRVAFGVSVGTGGTTLCGSTVVADGSWHHVAAVRLRTGAMLLFVDGVPDGSTQGPSGDASYRDGRPSTFQFDPTLVLGAEKHDAGAEYPSFSGWLDELRISTTARYSASFSPPVAPFSTDVATAALYHFDEGPAGACQGAILDVSGAAGGPSSGTCRYGGLTPAGPVYTTDQPFATTPATATHTVTPLPPTSTHTVTPAPPTSTNTGTPTSTNTVAPAPSTATSTVTPAPSTATNTTTPLAPTATHTGTSLPPTGTSTPAPSSPTATGTSVAVSTATVTPSTPSATSTPADNTATSTATFTPTSTNTPGGTIPPAPSSTPVGAATPDPGVLPTLAPCPTASATPSTTQPAAPAPERSAATLFLPAIQIHEPCAITTIPD